LKNDFSNEKEELCDVRVIHMEKVRQAKSEAAPEADLEKMAMTYKMLGDPTRLKILMALRDKEMCVCDLAAFAGLSESGTSHQLRRLKDLCLVKKRRDGKVFYYSLDDIHVSDLVEIGLAHVKEQG
jgi:DNA-binding transcriptional ArsR family regulator